MSILVISNFLISRLCRRRQNPHLPHGNAPQVKEQLTTAKHPPSAMEYYAAAMGVMFLLFAGMTGLQSIAAERRQQTLQRLLAGPASVWSFILGKFIVMLCIALSQFIILALGTALLFHVHWGNPLWVIMVAFAYATAVSGLTLAVSAWLTDERSAIGMWSIKQPIH